MNSFTLLFAAHILGDYYFQPERLAERKTRGINWALLHSAIYALTFALTLPLLSGDYAIAAAIAAVSHCIIDVVKQMILNASAKRGTLTIKGERLAFCMDQLIHLGVITVTSLTVTSIGDVKEPAFVQKLGETLGFGVYTAVSYFAMGLAMLKPANVFVKRILITQKPKDTGTEIPINAKRSGAYIGGLERLLILAFLALGQYASIAIVFTAKSIARFRALENREFAEYYLFGTLLSVVTAGGVFLFVKLFGVM